LKVRTDDAMMYNRERHDAIVRDYKNNKFVMVAEKYKHGFQPFNTDGEEYFFINEIGEDGVEKQVYKGIVSQNFKRATHTEYAKVRREYIEKMIDLNLNK
jgi:hypothetical protein